MKLPAHVLELVTQSHTIAVVGLSSNPARPSFGVARYLQQQGFRIVPVNPAESQVLGEPAFADLDAAARFAAAWRRPEQSGRPLERPGSGVEYPRVGPIDIVDVFRRAEFVPEVATAAIRIGARLLWLQEGVTHPEAEDQARAAGLAVVSDRCLLKEHARWRGRRA